MKKSTAVKPHSHWERRDISTTFREVKKLSIKTLLYGREQIPKYYFLVNFLIKPSEELF
jgi:hypothetical protein